MTMTPQLLIASFMALVVGYLPGSFLTADFVVKRKLHCPVSQVGTGNPGMANVMTNLGVKNGLLVLAGDLAKTMLAMGLGCLAASWAAGAQGALWGGFGALLGHNWPLWNKGHGGKGVTVSCCWLIIQMPLWGTLACLFGAAEVLAIGFLPLGAVLIAAAAVLPAFIFYGPQKGLAVLACAVIMISRHWHGLMRIEQGEEPRFFRRKKK